MSSEPREEISSRLTGRRYWRSLDDLADTEEFREILEREFPDRASEWSDPLGRRRFLHLMGASLALAGLAACASPFGEKIVPYVRQPEDLVPGEPLYYATAIRLASSVVPVLVTSTMGRPIKIEGNPDHPAGTSGSDVFTQAALLTLYDPDRSKTVTNLGGIRPFSDLISVLKDTADALRPRRGAGFRILTGAVTSPTLAAQIAALQSEFPEAIWHRHEPGESDGAREGARLAFGEALDPRFDFTRADILLSLDADFLSPGPGHLRHVRDFARRRRVASADRSRASEASPEMTRLYVLESMPSLAGAMADHRWRVRSSEIETVARAVAAAAGVPGVPVPASLPGLSPAELDAIVSDLRRRPGRGLVLAGAGQSPAVHALVHAVNHALGNVGSTATFVEPADASTGARPFSELVADMGAGRVGLLLILGGNPVFTAPADLRFGENLARVSLTVHLGLYDDETAARCHWHVPEAHDLESWSDARTDDGTVTLLQPLIEPLYAGRTAHELLAAFTKNPIRPSSEIVKEHWSKQRPGPEFPKLWERMVHDGWVPDTVRSPKPVALRAGAFAELPPPANGGPGDLEVVFRPDPSVHDGRFANNGWLQELPRPITKLTWDNAALISAGTAARRGLKNEDRVELSAEGRRVQAPIWIVPGHADDAVTIHLGYGRTRVGRVGEGTGFNAYLLRSSRSPWILTGAALRPVGDRYPLVTTQEHGSMEGRPLVRSATLARYREDPEFAREMEEAPDKDLTLYPVFKVEGHAWGMAIDLSACIGCNACTVACQAENNIPVVGKEQVARNRELHWIRVDRYFEGDADDPRMHHQPVPCMQCENAPCEQVCPVAATVHSSEGLNDMVYNRCVGTRYCANNCPYKVRRFNFLEYADFSTPSLKLLHNPNVTVRSRGVMEKCTYCVQRINAARNVAEEEGRPIRDGEILTACQQACPAEAIVFGDVNDPNSAVSKRKADPRNYALLAGLNTRPRTTYLASLRNPNPVLAKERT